MRRMIFVTLLLGILALLLDGAVLKPLFPGMLVPNFTVIILVYLAFFEASALGAFLAFMVGLEVDLCSGNLLGPWAGVYALTYLLLYLASKRVFVESSVALLVAIFVSSFSATIFHHCFIMVVRGKELFGSGVFSDALLEAFITALVGPFVIRLFRRFPLRRRDDGNRLSFLRS